MKSVDEPERPHPMHLSADSGPFDIIGDLHGCYDELVLLLEELGFHVGGTESSPEVSAAPGRRIIFLGDIVDRGPKSPQCLRLVMSMVRAGSALCILGNHDRKFARWLEGRDVEIAFGMAETIEQMADEPQSFHREVREFLESLPHHLVLDERQLVVAHAGLSEDLHGRDSKRARAFCVFGETTNERDAIGYPIRKDWAASYTGKARVVYGHTVVAQAEWRNRTICLDTGCVFGDRLTALRYPVLECVQVPARAVYCTSYP